MKFEEELFLEQYKQVWEQRRQHVGLYWQIPAVTTGIFVFLLKFFTLKTSNVWHILAAISLINLFCGACRIFLRHNYFVKVYGLLLEDMACGRISPASLPQFGDDLERMYHRRLKHWYEKCGSRADGMDSWIFIMVGIFLYFIFWFFGVINADFLVAICEVFC